MPALVAGIHVLHDALIQTWMAGTQAREARRPLDG